MENNETSGDFYIVGVGASAGGLDALEKFFSNALADSGLAFIVIQHLSPDYKSLMADLLSKRTDMPVHVAEDGMPVKPNNVYLIPPRQSLTIFHHKLYLTERESGQLYLPIDIFFQSLADDLGERAIGVILSGTGSDGTRGIRAIKEKGGLVIVQDEQSAKFDGMPRSAIATNLVDYVLPPEQMVREALNYIQHPCLASDSIVKRSISQDEDSLRKIFALLRSSSGVDFTYYKQNTMVRRIERRMGIKQVEKLSDYLHYLYQSPAEANTLYREFLIGVTRFFRDPEAFQYIKQNVIPEIFASKKRGDSIRIWVAGCSTGEEAYSLAILLTEYMETTGHHMDVKVFATDLDKSALEIAGKGLYPESIAADVSEDHLNNYFIKGGDSYTVTRRVREMVIFAQQNIITDPPFSKVDLISCRNVLIYLQPTLQKKVVTAFQFGLNPDGYLLLGTSETVGEAEDFFSCRDIKLKIYQYKGGFRPSLTDSRLSRLNIPLTPVVGRYQTAHDDWRAVDNIQRGLIEAFLPPVAVVDENQNLIYSVGDLDPYLRVPSGGIFTANVIKQAREGLSIPLSTAIHKALNDQETVVYRNIRLGESENAKTIDIITKPFFESGSRQKMAMIEFISGLRAQTENEKNQTYDVAENAQQRIQDLEHELQYTRESLQATVEELETSNEELQATNEELFAANEELQSTNEELHSVNEELITVNAEYHAKIQELTKLNEDINNLLSSANVGTLFLDLELRVRLFTPPTQKDFHLLMQDIGRPLRFVMHELVGCDLIAEAQEVLRTLTNRELEVQNSSGRWYQLRLSPYHTLQQQVGGVVLTLVDITELKSAEASLRQAERRYRSLLSALPDMSVMLFDHDHRFLIAGGEELTKNGFDSRKVEGATLAEAFPPEVAQQFAPLYNRALQGENISFEHNYGSHTFRQAIMPIRNAAGEIEAGMVLTQNVTHHVKMEEELRKSLEKYQALFDTFPYGITIADKDGKILEGNQEAERILGLPKEAQARRKIDDGEWKIIRPDSSDMPAGEYASVRALKEKCRVDNVKMGIVKAKNETAWINVSAIPLGDYGVVVIYHEIANDEQPLNSGKNKAKKK